MMRNAAFYTRAERQRIAALWAEGKSVPQIAVALARTAPGIEEFARRNRDICPRRNGAYAPHPSWIAARRAAPTDRAAFLAVASTVCGLAGVPFELEAAQGRRNSGLRGKAKLAHFATIYLTVTACGVSASRLSRVTGLNRAAIGRILTKVEDLRDEADFDALIGRMEAKLGVQ